MNRRFQPSLPVLNMLLFLGGIFFCELTWAEQGGDRGDGKRTQTPYYEIVAPTRRYTASSPAENSNLTAKAHPLAGISTLTKNSTARTLAEHNKSSDQTSRHPRAHAEVDNRFDEVLRSCFGDRNWQREQVSIVAPTDDLTVKWYHSINNVAKLGDFPIQAIEHVGDLAKSMIFADDNHRNAYTRMQLFANYINALAKKLPDDYFIDFKKGCMVACVAATYLKYKTRYVTKFGGIKSILEEGEGECTEFARFADDLADRVGISSRVVLANYHAFVKFYMPQKKKWLYIEPQSNGCTYFDQDGNTDDAKSLRKINEEIAASLK